MTLNVHARVAQLGELIPTYGLPSKFRSFFYVVRVNEYGKGIAEFFSESGHSHFVP